MNPNETGPCMVTVAEIKKALPDWPDDVINQWLHYFANEPDCGWPPPDPLGNHRWKGLLGAKPLSWWKKVSWDKQKLKCDLPSLTAKARADVREIITQMNMGTADESTKRRIARAWTYIKDNGVFPRSLVTIKKSDGVSLIDGTHRMAAFEMVQSLTDAQFAQLNLKRPTREQEVWIGTHSDGEVPDG
jgi:hypothetical protein